MEVYSRERACLKKCKSLLLTNYSVFQEDCLFDYRSMAKNHYTCKDTHPLRALRTCIFPPPCVSSWHQEKKPMATEFDRDHRGRMV